MKTYICRGYEKDEPLVSVIVVVFADSGKEAMDKAKKDKKFVIEDAIPVYDGYSMSFNKLTSNFSII